MADLFYLSDEQWRLIEPHMPKNQPGARRVISGIFHVLKTGCRWIDCPSQYGPHTTIYNRCNRWSRKRFWIKVFEAVAGGGAIPTSTAIDSTYIKARRSAFGGKGAIKRRRHLIENAFCRIKDFRRVATRYDKLAANFLSTVALACLLGYWL